VPICDCVHMAAKSPLYFGYTRCDTFIVRTFSNSVHDPGYNQAGALLGPHAFQSGIYP